MKTLAQIISYAALIALVAAPLAYLGKHFDHSTTKSWMLVATIGWFVSVPFWMGRKSD